MKQLPRSRQNVRVLRGQVAESVAGTYAEAAIATNLPFEQGTVMDIQRVEFSLALGSGAFGASLDAIEYQLVSSPQTDSIKVDDPDVIVADALVFSMVTSGAGFIRQLQVYDYANFPLYVARTNLYVGVKGVAMGAVVGVKVRVFYVPVKLSPVEMISLVSGVA